MLKVIFILLHNNGEKSAQVGEIAIGCMCLNKLQMPCLLVHLDAVQQGSVDLTKQLFCDV